MTYSTYSYDDLNLHIRTKCENTPEPVTMNDTLEMFDQNLVYNDNLEEGEKVDVE